ncbi:SCO family protein [Halomontanus rarus]|uniref:SCO family protein n=1 Tax=Halomontanus rarus TaxID=3034020 RepID=UPI0023E8C6F0|nr:SCO family protein [Halovivax sp. TS33]
MNRRHYLRSTAVATVGSIAGCLETLSGTENGRTVLESPERDLSEASHPSYEEELPAITLPDPIGGEKISTEQFEDERPVLLTFFYTNCPDGVCPALLLRLRRAQEVAAAEGYSDDAAFLAMTFDPERDTEDVLRTYAGDHGVDLEAGNWHFLRPERYDDGKEILTEAFGLPLEKREAEDYENLEYIFPHFAYIFLANERGIVERVYPNGASVEVSRVVDDFETVVTA